LKNPPGRELHQRVPDSGNQGVIGEKRADLVFVQERRVVGRHKFEHPLSTRRVSTVGLPHRD